MACKNVLILGSTGSIGVNALKVIERYPSKFKIIGLTAYNNHKLLEQQIKKFSPKYAAIGSKGFNYLKSNVSGRKTKILSVDSDLEYLASLKSVDVVLIGMRSSDALGPFLTAVKCGKTVAPANKEALVIAGEIIMKEARKSGSKIIPVDSEQSAIFQCLQQQGHNQLKRVLLTASGGALLNVPSSRFKNLNVADILNHPRWKMGKKITVDSATLMNKGFEIIEAQRLFDLKVEDIEVVVHPEAIIHSMVEFIDGSIIAQLGITDMRLPIQYALTYPDRLDSGLKGVDFFKLKQFNFMAPDVKRFPSLALAIYVGKKGGTLPSVLNAADEEAVDAFLNGSIKFLEIYRIVEKIVRKHKVIDKPNISSILDADKWAREETRKVIGK